MNLLGVFGHQAVCGISSSLTRIRHRLLAVTALYNNTDHQGIPLFIYILKIINKKYTQREMHIHLKKKSKGISISQKHENLELSQDKSWVIQLRFSHFL